MNEARQALLAQQKIHKKIAQHMHVDDILAAIIDMVARELPDALVSLMLLDAADNTLSLVASRGLSEAYRQAAQKVPVGNNIAACGASAYRKEIVITDDIEHDINWADFLVHTRGEGLASCWSAPVLTAEGELLGTFATYYRYPRVPKIVEQTRLLQAADLLALAIVSQRDRQTMQAHEQRFRSLFTYHPDGVFELDLTGHFVNSNQTVTQMTGLSAAQLKGKHYEEFVAQEDWVATKRVFELVCQGAPQRKELSVSNALQKRYRLDVTKLPIIIDDEVVGVYGIARNVTEQRLQETELRLLQLGVDATPNGVVMADATDPELPLVYSNAAFHEISGYSKEEVIGKNCRFLQGKDTDPKAIAEIRTAIAEQKEHQVTVLNYRKDGTPFWNLFSLAPVFSSAGQPHECLVFNHRGYSGD